MFIKKTTFNICFIIIGLMAGLFLLKAHYQQPVVTTTANHKPSPRKISNNQKHQKVTILMYHKVNPYPWSGGLGLRVNPVDFDQQMYILNELGYTVVSFNDVYSADTKGQALPPRPLIITFDDGYRDNYRFALPILRKHHYPATIFLVYNHIGGNNYWDWVKGAPNNPLLNWVEIKKMRNDQITFGSHTLSHPHLAKLKIAEATKEITQSKLKLEESLGQPVNFFCYPYGNYNKEVMQAVHNAGYKAAVSTKQGIAALDTNPFDLRRIRVMGNYDRAKFIHELQRFN